MRTLRPTRHPASLFAIGFAFALTLAASAQAQAPEPAEVVAGVVTRAAITNGIDAREPINAMNRVTNDHETIYFFTELRDFDGQEVIHRWLYRGEVMAEVPFLVGGKRWRVWSTKTMKAEWLGEWRVEVVSAHGEIFETSRFEYVVALDEQGDTGS